MSKAICSEEMICAQSCDKNYIVEYNHYGYENTIK